MVAIKQRRWSSSEEKALKAGIDKYGEGKWSKILKDRKFGSILHLRSNVNLKDKWRNIVLMKKAFARHRVRGALRNVRKIVKRRKRSLRTFVLSHPDVVAKPLTVLSGTSQVSENMTNKVGSRHGVRGARRNSRKTMNLGDMSLSTAVLSDPSIVVRKPRTVSSRTSKISQLDSIKIPMLRLDNPMVDARSKAKEPHGSSQTTVATYLEKTVLTLSAFTFYEIYLPLPNLEGYGQLLKAFDKKGKVFKKSQISGVAGEYPDPPQELFEKSKRIEVLTREEGFSDSWYVATVIDPPSPMSHLKRKNSDSVASFNKYYVEYEMLMDDDDTSCPLKECVDAQLIRPLCPLTSVRSFQVKDIVDAFYYDGWWIGVVTKSLSNSRFEVMFGAPFGEHEFHISELRLHLDWVNGQWINPRTQKRAAESHITVGKEVEVSFEKDHYEVWFPATVLKDFGDDSYLVHYVCKKGHEVSPKRATVCLPHIRPKPPQQKNKSFLLSDKVDAFYGCAWTCGLITKEFTDKKFVVSFKRKRTKVFSKTKLRRHMEWVDGRWLDASKSREADNVASHLMPPKKFKTVDEAEIPTLTACETDTMNSKSSSKQHSSLIVCQNDAVVMKAPGNGQSSRKTENRSSSNEVIKEKKLSKLDSDTPKIVKRRGRPPKIHKSSPNDVRTAEEIKEKHCETQGFTLISSGLTRDETRNLRDDIPCQPSPERSQAVIRNQIVQGNVPARLIIEQNMENGLSRGTFPELLETMNRMEIPTEPNQKVERVVLSEKMVKHYLRKGGKRSVDPSTESPYSIVYDNVSNAGVRTSEGTEEKACETEDIAPILIDLTGSPQDNIPCQSPPEGSRRVIGDQNSQGNVPARLVIEEKAENTLSKQREMSSELLELRSRKELPRHGEDVSEQVFSVLPNTYPPSSASLGLKCLLWDCTRPAQGFDYCSSHHAALALKEGTPGMNPVLRPGGTGLKECLLFAVLNAKAQGKDVGIPECERPATAKSPWNAPELFDLNVHEGETIREWLFFDKPRSAFKKGKKQLSLPDYNGRGWHESRRHVMNDFGGQKRSYYMDPQPSKDSEWHLYEYEIFNIDACALYRLEFKRVGSKKSKKGKSTNDSVADLQKQIEKSSELLEPRSRMEIPTDGNVSYPGVRIAEGTEEKDCDMEDIAPILNGLTNNRKRSRQDNIPSQSPPEIFQTFISDQRGQGNVSARLLMKKSTENSLSKQRGMSPELLEPESSMVILTESNEVAKHVLLYDKMVKRYLRNRGKGSADPSTESPHSIVYGNVSNAGVRTSRGTEGKACETEDIAPILIDLTGSPRDNSPCQSPPEESQTVICDRNGQVTVPARLAIEERVENSLSKQRSTSPELLELRSRMEIPTESSEMAECVVSRDKMWKNYLSTGGKRSVDSSTESPHFIVDGIRTVEGREEKKCETEELAPIHRLTCDGTKSPQHNSICQSPPERSHTLIPYQTGEGNTQAKLNIEESAENSLTKQIGTSPELLEPMTMMEIPTESTEKAKCVVSSNKLLKTYIRKRRKKSANLSTESSHSFLDGASSKETEVHNAAANNTPSIDLDVNQILPFKKTLPLWDSIESMEVFQLFPQKPHFRALENNDEYCREGLALGQMVTFSKIVKTINEMRADMPRSAMEKCLENLIVLEDNGFDVRSIRDRLKSIEQESRIMEFREKKRKIVEDVDEIEKKLKELQAKREATMSEIKRRDSAIKASRSLLNNISDRLESIPFDFDEMAAAPW